MGLVQYPHLIGDGIRKTVPIPSSANDECLGNEFLRAFDHLTESRVPILLCDIVSVDWPLPTGERPGAQLPRRTSVSEQSSVIHLPRSDSVDTQSCSHALHIEAA